jgi:DNA-directed RNA polymerase specialized sigma24 family protein
MTRSREQGRLSWLAGIYQAYAADLQRYIYGRVGEWSLAEDLTSTVFLKALRWLREDPKDMVSLAKNALRVFFARLTISLIVAQNKDFRVAGK